MEAGGVNMSDKRPGLRVFGSTVVGPKGQVVIPAGARKELGINPGDTLLACGDPRGDGLMLLKIDAVERILSMMTEDLASFSKLMQDYRSGKNGTSEIEE
jgi:bifunctional DNA-binding transcriptional regulator/antitoxin component of YhaV-PrlF toxin-antitoxin module